MGWKNVKEHYRIGHVVQVTCEGICIGSPFVHNILVVGLDGVLKKKRYDLGVFGGNEDLKRYEAEMDADPEKLRHLVQSPDTFATSIPLYTYRDGDIVEVQCEELGWPNVTHDGALMYENTFSTDKTKVVAWAKTEAQSGVHWREKALEEAEKNLVEYRARLAAAKADLAKLEAEYPDCTVAELEASTSSGQQVAIMKMPCNPFGVPASREELIAIAAADFDPSRVAVDENRIQSVPWPTDKLRPMRIEVKGTVGQSPISALSFLLLANSLNFRFWRGAGVGLERYAYAGKTGARALWASFENAWGSDDATCGSFSRAFRENGVAGIFGDIPDMPSRATILDKMLSNDLSEFCEQLSEKINETRSITVADAATVARKFPSAYGDPYLKKAQLALSMYGAYLRERGSQIDVSDLTAFADYQVPRVLRALGILRYSKAVAADVDKGRLIAPGSAEERAIRAATILAVEQIATHCNRCAADVDNLLWASQEIAQDTRFHLTETTSY